MRPYAPPAPSTAQTAVPKAGPWGVTPHFLHLMPHAVHPSRADQSVPGSAAAGAWTRRRFAKVHISYAPVHHHTQVPEPQRPFCCSLAARGSGLEIRPCCSPDRACAKSELRSCNEFKVPVPWAVYLRSYLDALLALRWISSSKTGLRHMNRLCTGPALRTGWLFQNHLFLLQCPKLGV